MDGDPRIEQSTAEKVPSIFPMTSKRLIVLPKKLGSSITSVPKWSLMASLAATAVHRTCTLRSDLLMTEEQLLSILA